MSSHDVIASSQILEKIVTWASDNDGGGGREPIGARLSRFTMSSTTFSRNLEEVFLSLDGFLFGPINLSLYSLD
ncbi:MAG TPA: hypothetical protein PK957_01470 [Candidatus Dojkabacteria bacterium]|nr:hypothetical protein [Candidatus Dojkabacteria bacterium]HQF36344.1 hypothetical protein [Candidatus Dojkabacteria bacterium]